MRNLHKSLAVSCLLLTFSLPASSEDQQQGMQHGGMMGMGGMGGMMSGMSEEQKNVHLRKMQAHMLKMHDLSNRILAETDAVKKQKLKDEQLQEMKDHMKKMMEMRMGDMSEHHKKMMQEQEGK